MPAFRTGGLVRRAWRALMACAAIAAAAPPLPAAELSPLQPPRFTRQQMDATAGTPADFVFVYGTLDPALAPVLRARAAEVARRLFGSDSSRVRADRAATAADLAAANVVLLGDAHTNAWTARLAPGLPVVFTARGFRWQAAAYDRPGDAIHLVYPNPLAPRRYLLLLAGNSAAALRVGGLLFGREDWRITREGELARSGRFAQSPARPWAYDAALDRDLDVLRARFAAGLHEAAGGGLRVRAASPAAAAALLARGRTVLANVDAMGLAPPPGAGAIRVTVYASLLEKGVLTRNTRPEHLGEAGAVHVAVPAGRQEPDLWSVAAARLVRAGASPSSRYLEPVAAWLAGRFEGEPLAVSLRRLYFGRQLWGGSEAARRDETWRSPLLAVPARALLARAVWECSPVSGRRRALMTLLRPGAPGTLDSLCAAAGLPPARVAARCRELADSLARAAPRPSPAPAATWRPADGFQAGVCLEHTVGLESGYLSAACVRELGALRAAGAGWISITPFGMLPDPHRPVLWSSATGGPDEESDEALEEAASRAHALGLHVWLSPHLWTRGWTGDLSFASADWPVFFSAYREFLLHWAVFAEREHIEGLFVGHELASATAHDPLRWRALIAEVRQVYSGTLSYAANWDEASRVPFWDALDLVGVSFYAPLAAGQEREVPALQAAAARALSGLEHVGRASGRPVLLAEIGYPARPTAALRPWDEGSGLEDAELQQRCYRALIGAMAGQDWLAGALWWKWPSDGGAQGRREASYSPRGRPAEAELRAALRAWRGRGVRIPAPASR